MTCDKCGQKMCKNCNTCHRCEAEGIIHYQQEVLKHLEADPRFEQFLKLTRGDEIRAAMSMTLMLKTAVAVGLEPKDTAKCIINAFIAAEEHKPRVPVMPADNGQQH